jgi:hypothetical protein
MYVRESERTRNKTRRKHKKREMIHRRGLHHRAVSVSVSVSVSVPVPIPVPVPVSSTVARGTPRTAPARGMRAGTGIRSDKVRGRVGCPHFAPTWTSTWISTRTLSTTSTSTSTSTSPFGLNLNHPTLSSNHRTCSSTSYSYYSFKYNLYSINIFSPHRHSHATIVRRNISSTRRVLSSPSSSQESSNSPVSPSPSPSPVSHSPSPSPISTSPSDSDSDSDTATNTHTTENLHNNTTKRSFYQNDELESYANRPSKRVTIRQLTVFGRSLTQEKLIKSANYLRQELPVRLAHRIVDFQRLPFIVGTNPHIERVYSLYWQAFETFRRFPEIHVRNIFFVFIIVFNFRKKITL